MAGDIQALCAQLTEELNKTNFLMTNNDRDEVLHGVPSIFIRILQHIFFHSKEFCNFLQETGQSFFNKDNQSFLHAVYKTLVSHLHYRPVVSMGNFLTPYKNADRKIKFCLDVLKIVKKFTEESSSMKAVKTNEKQRGKTENSKFSKSSLPVTQREPRSYGGNIPPPLPPQPKLIPNVGLTPIYPGGSLMKSAAVNHTLPTENKSIDVLKTNADGGKIPSLKTDRLLGKSQNLTKKISLVRNSSSNPGLREQGNSARLLQVKENKPERRVSEDVDKQQFHQFVENFWVFTEKFKSMADQLSHSVDKIQGDIMLLGERVENMEQSIASKDPSKFKDIEEELSKMDFNNSLEIKNADSMSAQEKNEVNVELDEKVTKNNEQHENSLQNGVVLSDSTKRDNRMISLISPSSTEEPAFLKEEPLINKIEVEEAPLDRLVVITDYDSPKIASKIPPLKNSIRERSLRSQRLGSTLNTLNKGSYANRYSSQDNIKEIYLNKHAKGANLNEVSDTPLPSTTVPTTTPVVTTNNVNINSYARVSSKLSKIKQAIEAAKLKNQDLKYGDYGKSLQTLGEKLEFIGKSFDEKNVVA